MTANPLSAEGMPRGGRPVWLVPAAAAVAVVSAMCGIGGGLFAVPLLHFVAGMPLRRAVGTALALVFVTTASSTVTEVFHDDSRLRWGLVATLAVGALIGTQLGYRVSRRIDQRRLRLVFAVVLSLAGLRILLAPERMAEAAATAGGTEPWHHLVAALAGFGGGFLAPLLGVGGGLLMVPVLFLGVPGMGYLGARACSLAVGALASARSVFLYLREGAIDARTALWIGLGALLGAVPGVYLVHWPGWSRAAQMIMGTILLGVALRFALSAREERLKSGGES